jgi:hypothetical protein
MDYIEKTDNNIIDFSKDQLVDELSLIKEDLIELGENNVEIGDLREENTISNESSFYLIDFAKIKFLSYTAPIFE